MLAPESLEQLLNWRYATKRFDPSRAIPDRHWAVLERALHLAPSSFGLQPWKFLVIDDPALRAELRPVSWKQPQITEASKLVVFTSRRTITEANVDRLIRVTSETRGVPTEALETYRSTLLSYVEKSRAANTLADWNTRQLYIALGQFMSAAAVLGVDTCPIEGLDPAEYDRILGLEDSEFATRVVCAAGYRHAEDKYALLPKVRYPIDEVIERR